MKKLYLLISLLFVLCVFSSPAFGANWTGKTARYVRSGATGTGSGLNWTDAYTDLPGTLTRDYVYYVADGTYSTYTFDDNESGSLWIYVVKATASDHGAAGDWSSAYGDGQAAFNGTINVSKGYLEINGQARDDDDWFDINSYGFKINHNGSAKQLSIGRACQCNPDHLIFEYIGIQAQQGLPGDGHAVGWYAVEHYNGSGTQSGDGFTDVVFGHMLIKNGCVGILHRHTQSGVFVQYSAFDNNESEANYNHGEAHSDYYVSGVTIRWNKYRDIQGTAVIACNSGSGHVMYGNVIYNTVDVGDGAIGFSGGSANNNCIFNNTFVDNSDNSANITDMGATNRNNVWVNCASSGLRGTSSGTNNTTASTSIFSNYANDDFSLGTDTAAGIDVSALGGACPAGTIYDMNGVAYGSDGDWELGAYAYDAGATPSIIKKIMNFFRRLRG